MALQHLRASTANKRPAPASMADGQLAINTNDGSPGLYFKDSNSGLVKVGPVHVGTTAPNASPASGGTSGNSKGELWLDTTNSDYTLKTWDGSAWREIVVTSAMIKNGELVNDDVNANAAIAGTKISPNFGSQNRTSTGTSTAASFIPTSSTVPANGIYLPSANTVGISTNSGGRLFINSSGSVGIGTANPSRKFQVEEGATTGTFTLARFSSYNGTNSKYLEVAVDNTEAAPVVYFDASKGAGSNPSLAFSIGGTECARIDSSARLLFGTSSAVVAGGSITSRLQLHGTDGSSSSWQTTRWSANTSSPFNSLQKSRGASVGTRAIVVDGDDLGVLSFSGDDGTNFVQAAIIKAVVDGTPGTNDMPGRLVFSTTADGSSSPSERLRIDSSGRLLHNTTTALTASSIQPHFQQIGTILAAATELKLCFSSDTTSGGTIYLAKSKNNTATIGGGTGLVSADDRIGVIRFFGDDGSTLVPAAQIESCVDGTPGAGDMPGRLVFSTTADGASSSSQRMVINKDGFVGIGVTAPACMLQMASSTSTGLTARLTLDNTESNSGISIAAGGSAFSQSGWPTLTDVAIVRASGNSSGGLALQAGATAPITFWGPTTEWARFDTLGRLGIGNTSPERTLHVAGEATFINNTQFLIAPTTNNVRLYARDATTGAQNLSFNVGSTEAARIDTSARFLVGLSTANSTYTLTSGFTGEAPHTQISSSARATMSLVRTNGPGTLVLANSSTVSIDSPAGTLLFNAGDGTNIIPAAFIGANIDGTPGTNDMPGRMVFATTSDGASSPTERLRITSAGNVGINQTSPGSTLDVKGTVRLSGGTSGYVGLAPAAAAGSTTYTLPSADGAAGQVLSTNGSGTLSWATDAVGFRNRIINGGMAVSQRGGANAATYTAGAALAYGIDRWYAYCTGANVTGQQVAGATAGQFYQRFTGGASVTAIGFGQRIEQLNSADLAGTTATLSVDLANSLLTTVTWTAYYATTPDTFGTLASPTRTQIATGTFTVNSTVTRYSANISIPSAATTGIEILFTVGAQTSGTWTIGSVQLEPGSAATPFERRMYGTELALCQRYCFRGSGPLYTSSVQTISIVNFPVTMRSAPSSVITGNGANGGTWIAYSAGAVVQSAYASSTASQVEFIASAEL